MFAQGSARRKEIEELITRYPNRPAALLPALWMVQHERGWVSDDGMAEVAELLGITPAYVKGVVTFYTMYHQHPVGKYFIQVCTTSPCNACGAEGVVDAFLRHTGCQELGQTSPDGKFGVIEVECLGACGFATAVMINRRFRRIGHARTRARNPRGTRVMIHRSSLRRSAPTVGVRTVKI